MSAQWVRDIAEEFLPHPPPRRGEVWIYEGEPVIITGGCLWGAHGLSNWWSFRPLLDDGSLGEPERGAYDNDRGRFHPREEALR